MHPHVGLMQAIDVFTELALDEEPIIGDNYYNSFLFVTKTSLGPLKFIRNVNKFTCCYISSLYLFKIASKSLAKSKLEWPLHLLPRHWRLQLGVDDSGFAKRIWLLPWQMSK